MVMLVIPSIGKAQQFDILYDHNGFANDGGSIVKTEGGYFTTHAAYDINLGSYSVLFANFDEEGNLFWDTTFTTFERFFSFNGSYYYKNFISTTSGTWVFANSTNVADNDQKPTLIRTSIDGVVEDIIFIDTLYSLIPDIYIPTVLSGTFANNHIYITGLYVVGQDIFLFLIKCDLNGNFIWNRSFPLNGVNISPTSLIDTGDGLLMGGRRYAAGPDGDYEDERYFRKFNYDGWSQWTRTYFVSEQMSLGVVNMIPLDNGNFLFASNRHQTSGYSYMQPLIGEINDANGDTLWTKTYFDTIPSDFDDFSTLNSYNRLMGFKKLSDGGYIGVGTTRIDIIPDSAWGPIDDAAFMMKLDADYNLLWKRVYVPQGYAELEASPARCHLNDFVENEDGSITALGRAYMYTGSGPQGGYIQDSFLIRVDSLGCLVSGCAVGITEWEEQQDVLVYPNPASTHTTIEFPTSGNWNISLYNLQGALVSQDQLKHTQQFQLDLQYLPAGIYTIQCNDGRGRWYTSKVVKL